MSAPAQELDDDDEYDDSPWTSEERHALAWEMGKHLGWDEMTAYDDMPDDTADSESADPDGPKNGKA